MNIGKLAAPASGPEQGTFRMVPDSMWSDDRVKDFDIRLWCVLNFYARGRDRCEPTDSSVAATMSVSVATVKRGLQRLEAAGWIIRQHDQADNRTIFFTTQENAQTSKVFRLRVAQA